jgi:hypothetical protein
MTSSDQTQQPTENPMGVSDAGPMIVAYRIGRSIRRLQFIATQAWVGTASVAIELDLAFDDIRALVRQAVAPDKRDTAATTVESYRSNLSGMMASEEHAESWYECNQQLANFRGGDFGALVKSECHLLLAPLGTFVDQLRIDIRNYFDVDGRLAASFGYSVESGLCHADLYRPALASDPPTEKVDLAVENVLVSRRPKSRKPPNCQLPQAGADHQEASRSGCDACGRKDDRAGVPGVGDPASRRCTAGGTNTAG